MISNWQQFFEAVKQMRKHQKVYFDTRDPVALGMSKKLEKIVDECIAERDRRKDDSAKTGGAS
jgi:hypothetical protein